MQALPFQFYFPIALILHNFLHFRFISDLLILLRFEAFDSLLVFPTMSIRIILRLRHFLNSQFISEHFIDNLMIMNKDDVLNDYWNVFT